ncbi:ribosome-associated ATPase/putative transporter RbbA [Sneathiella limimaris]|uniref:ribosome-associated ATPase/putative transporter RbbA n=1 Tax=Sneathiella limimaris TaxID=1964213 RepID=UPI00146F70EF|nr:ribosome-associated ATPase/putative transporter RbbA [Sneathiella limimaris]
MTDADTHIVRLKNLSHQYGSTKALSNISLDIPSGCLVGLIGPDGVGKSTLLGLISGVRKIQQGSVVTLDADMASRRQRRKVVDRIAYMPQGLGKNLYPTLSVQENLNFFGRLFNQSKRNRQQKIRELTSATGLLPFLKRPAGKLSGGMKQKLGLCCALIHDPDLLILDEPTTGIDPLSRKQFWELIDRLRERRPEMSVLVSTAYMDEAERFDWLVAMDAGAITATGTSVELLQRTQSETLEEAFIGLLPEQKRAQYRAVEVPPRDQSQQEVAIHAENLTMRFGDFTAVDHVSFEIAKGEIFGFLGSNGCGKTTTMKMLTGLLPASEGHAELFGQPLNARDMAIRKRIGYMSQSFSLYHELSVLKNLNLHADLFNLSRSEKEIRVKELLDRFNLEPVKDQLPDSLPLGVRQRLQLAVAILHKPEVLILDEPTSGVDPIARDQFWQLLIDLSRNEGVTIFISTHFMNEAQRCDRVSLMHAGKVLAVGEPEDLRKEQGAETLEEAFVSVLQDASEVQNPPNGEEPLGVELNGADKKLLRGFFSLRRMLAYTLRESKELMRDPIRLAFAFIGPVILMITFGYGISFDVEDLTFAVFDQDQSLESRTYLENFRGSRYFEEQAPITNSEMLERRLKSGELKFVIEVPSEFGRDLLAGRKPELAIWIDGAMPFRAETARGYIQGVTSHYLEDMSLRRFGLPPDLAAYELETRFRYNQSFKSTYAIVPGTIMLLCIIIPAMLTAVGVVREKEMGSITNFYATPVNKLEFLLGKQIPYVALAFMNFFILLVLALLVFEVPMKGSWLALISGAFLYVCTTTGFGIFVSSFVRSQIAAIFATAIISVVLTMNFSGFMTPVSTLGGTAQLMGKFFPAPYFQQISVGGFTKALQFEDLMSNHLALIAFAIGLFGLAALLLKKQEK